MITLDDWSELVTVDYIAGLSGEFFGLLLHQAINPSENITFKNTDNNKYDFSDYDVFTNFKEKTLHDKTKLKKIYYFKNKFYNFNESKQDIEDKKLTKLYDDIFKNRLDFSSEYKRYIYENYGHRFDGKLKISLVHDVSNELNRKHSISLLKIFPKSKNIMLVCPNHYMFFSNFLMSVKIISHHSLIKNKEELKNYIDKQYDNFTNFRFYEFDDYPCLKIDIYSLLYDKKNYDEEISNLLGQNIVLDKEKINEYAEKNIEIFDRYGLDIFCVYSKKHFKEKVDYFIRSCL